MAGFPRSGWRTAVVSRGSCGLRGDERLERVEVVAIGEGEERLGRRGAVTHVGLEHALDGRRRVLRLYIAVDFAAERGVRAKGAADMNVIALDRVALVQFHLRRDQADLADEVLGAGVMAAGEMDVDRLIESDARLAPVGDRRGVPLGVGEREFAARVAGAGDGAGAQ